MSAETTVWVSLPAGEERSEEHTSELQSLRHLVCRLLLEKKNPDKRPILGDLRESGSIEQDSDAVMFLYRPEYYDSAVKPGVAEVHVAQDRDAATGTSELK